ncbi:uncharacterized protein BJ212DRAFT_1331236 [Suillus subaureus]|uniref:Uncharacterized protein n=1 Tax=Suillus subaureus TaxID=48587 RepID=A0A9P7EK70_9AGAM|nr:uncharacterized protein BJ212DRAFT_1331236 [Suillus subaureus]KAG1822894.1 hypothetical protein BJ212DRAFT_1331236 [Suillus subaureus]
MAPHASLSVAPPDSRPTKRPRLSKSTHRVLNVWAQLAERYNKRLDEDDIVDLYSGTIISDRGVLKNGKDYDFGHFTPDDSQDDRDQEQEQEPSEQDQDDDVDELDTLPVRRAPGTDGTMASTSELLRAVPPLSATTDADDLNDFLKAEKRRRELLGDEDGEDDMSMEELAALREALHESEEDEEQPETVDPEHAAVIEDESEDELDSIWQHDEASAVYHITRNESEQDVAEGEQTILEFADSDEEFAALLERPPRAGKRKRNSSFSSQRKYPPSSSQRTPSPSSPLRTYSPSSLQRTSSSSSPLQKPSPSSSRRKPLPSSPLQKPSPSSSRRKPLPFFPLRKSSPSSLYRCPSSDSTLVPDTPSTTASTRFASRTPRAQVYPFAAPSVDPTQPPQLLLYQAMHQLSYALSATMLTYGSPHMPPPPTGPWGAYPPGFAHPWGPQGTSEASHSFKLGNDEHDDDRPDDDGTLVGHDGGTLENDRRRRRSTSPIGSRRDARKIERRRSARFYEETYQDQRFVARGRTPGTPSPTRSLKESTSTNKKKGKAKRKS